MDERLADYITKLDRYSLIISRRLSQEVRPVLGDGLTMAQFLLMRLVGQQGALHVSEAAEVLGVTVSAVTSLCDRLESSGWLQRQRDEADRRAVVLRLTEAGQAKLAELDERVSGLVSRYLVRLPQADLDHLLTIMEQLAALMEEPS